MTRKDYVILAAALRATHPCAAPSGQLTLTSAAESSLWARTVRSVATALGRDNPRFDLQRFLRACGAPE